MLALVKKMAINNVMSIITRFVVISRFKENSSKNALIEFKNWNGSVGSGKKSIYPLPHIFPTHPLDFWLILKATIYRSSVDKPT